MLPSKVAWGGLPGIDGLEVDADDDEYIPGVEGEDAEVEAAC